MKQKILWGLLILCAVALTKLGYDVYHGQRKQIQALLQQQQDGQQQLADLNDRLIAVARQQASPMDALGNPTQLKPAMDAAEQLQLEMQRNELYQLRQHWLTASLKLAEQSLQQGQWLRASQLLQEVETQLLSQKDVQKDAMSVALLKAIKIDQVQVEHARAASQISQQQIDPLLNQLQQRLMQLSNQRPNYAAEHHDEASNNILHRLSHILVIEPASPLTQQAMASRSLVCRQIAFSIGLSRQALSVGNYELFIHYLDDALTQIQPLTDDDVRQVAIQLSRIRAQQLPAPVTLTSYALLDSQRDRGL